MKNIKLSENIGGYSPTKKPLTKFMTNALRTHRVLLSESRKRTVPCMMLLRSIFQHWKNTISAMLMNAVMLPDRKAV